MSDKKEHKKMGRPTDNPRRKKIGIRLSDEEMRMLESYSKKFNITRTDTIAKGITKLYKEEFE